MRKQTLLDHKPTIVNIAAMVELEPPRLCAADALKFFPKLAHISGPACRRGERNLNLLYWNMGSHHSYRTFSLTLVTLREVMFTSRTL
jgi:hypothetical protein